MTVLRFADHVPSSEQGEEMRRHLAAGGVLALATESSYGLAADPRSARGVEAIYRMKERDRGKPLPVIAADTSQLAVLGVDLSSPAITEGARYWPAPLTLVLPAEGPQGPWPAAAGGVTLAARVPAHEPLRKLLFTVGFPLTATSANLAGQAPILDAAELVPWTAEHPLWIVDSGVAPGGPPSTIVVRSEDGWRLIRDGRFPFQRLLES